MAVAVLLGVEAALGVEVVGVAVAVAVTVIVGMCVGHVCCFLTLDFGYIQKELESEELR